MRCEMKHILPPFRFILSFSLTAMLSEGGDKFIERKSKNEHPRNKMNMWRNYVRNDTKLAPRILINSCNFFVYTVPKCSKFLSVRRLKILSAVFTVFLFSFDSDKNHFMKLNILHLYICFMKCSLPFCQMSFSQQEMFQSSFRWMSTHAHIFHAHKVEWAFLRSRS